jgi:hypothetical protein
VTEFKEFPGRSHYTLGQEGWDEVADPETIAKKRLQAPPLAYPRRSGRSHP